MSPVDPRSPFHHGEPIARQLAGCALSVVRLLVRRRLHRRNDLVGASVTVGDGRRFTVFRDTTCDEDGTDREVTLLVWFHLRGTSPRHRWRSWLFERESLVNTILFAGFDGYQRKLWMVDRASADYAGLYSWRGREAAAHYRRYITTVLRPLSTPGTVGSEIVEQPLGEYLAVGHRLDPGPSPGRQARIAHPS